MSSNLKKPQPPRLAKWLLESFCSYDFLSTAMWDLQELFERNVASKGFTKARILYLTETLSIVTHLFFKGKSQYSTKTTAMLKHNLIIALRNFKRYKATFLINLFGLATGLASALLIYLWVNDELKMGQFDEKFSDRHYQVYQSNKLSDGIRTEEWLPFPLANAMDEELPEVEKAVSVYDEPYYKGVISLNGIDLRAKPLFVTGGYFDIFECNFVAGSKNGALKEGNVVISAQMANSLFEDPQKSIGKTVNFKGEYFKGPYIVTGVFEPSSHSTISFDILLTLDHFLGSWRSLYDWGNGGPQTHLVLKEGIDLNQFNKKISTFLSDLEVGRSTLITQKYSDKYLYGKFENGVPVAGRMIYVRSFSVVAIFILVIACINYMNLSTAQASRRVKEIGVKKAIGANRSNLVYQYFSESLIISVISLILAIALVVILLPQFNNITGKSLSIQNASSAIISALIITITTGLVSGIYPGLYLSGLKPVLALKGKLQSKSGGLWLRKGLMVFQFTTSVILVISVMVIYKQMNFIKQSNLGYDTDHLITFNADGKFKDNDATSFMAEVQNLPGVLDISYFWGDLPGDVSSSSGFRWKGQKPEDKNTRFNFIEGGHKMAEVLGVELIKGRYLSPDFATDDESMVINETAANLFGFENTIGEMFHGKEIVGVVKDFHSKGLHEKIGPFFFTLDDEGGESFMVRIRAENQTETIKKIESLHNTFNPGYPLEFSFMDDQYAQLYIEEERTATLSKYFSAIGISISCLGLLALTAFSTQRRFKEIAIRKVLGSSSLGIVQLLSKEYISLVFVAIMIALPIGFSLMKNWLESFAYRIDLEPVLFVLSGLIIVFIAWLTIMAQTAKSANVNVTESLRSE